MLVLSRKKNESLLVGDTIEVVIVDIRGDKVRIGINAPVAVPVHRREVYDAIQRQGGALERPAPIDWQYKCGQLVSELEALKKENAELRLKLAV